MHAAIIFLFCKVLSPEVAGVCEVIPIKIFGILLGWAIVIVIVAAALIAGTVYVVSKHGDQVAVLFQNFRISALFLTIALYAVAGIAIYYAWTFDNPALLQSDELVAKLSYATTNNSNSSYAVNLSGIEPQMHRFVAAGLILVLVLLGVSFAFVALSTLHWDACRMVRILGLIPLLFIPMAGFSAFMAQSNWLSVVYMGTFRVVVIIRCCHDVMIDKLSKYALRAQRYCGGVLRVCLLP